MTRHQLPKFKLSVSNGIDFDTVSHLQKVEGYFFTESEMEILKRIAKKDKEDNTNVLQEIILGTEYGVKFMENLNKLKNE
jgi:hypothetical protein